MKCRKCSLALKAFVFWFSSREFLEHVILIEIFKTTSIMFEVLLGRLTIAKLHPLLYTILCVSAHKLVFYLTSELPSLFSDSVDWLVSGTYEHKCSTVAADLATPKNI